jgi:hypothetical protein
LITSLAIRTFHLAATLVKVLSKPLRGRSKFVVDLHSPARELDLHGGPGPPPHGADPTLQGFFYVGGNIGDKLEEDLPHEKYSR